MTEQTKPSIFIDVEAWPDVDFEHEYSNKASHHLVVMTPAQIQQQIQFNRKILNVMHQQHEESLFKIKQFVQIAKENGVDAAMGYGLFKSVVKKSYAVIDKGAKERKSLAAIQASLKRSLG